MNLKILSLGAGVQSSTLALMMEKGLVQKPDYAVFSDTQGEPKQVYEWLEWLKTQLSFPVLKVSTGSLPDDLRKSNRDEYVRGATIPMFTKNKKTGKKGIIRRACTATYKIEPVTKKIREILGVPKGRKVPKEHQVIQYFGISRDEPQRMRTSSYHYITFGYPLIDLKITRQGCKDWMKENGYPEPPRSACTFCPYHDNTEWQNVKSNKEEWEEVLKLDEQLRTGLRGTNRTEVEYFLHRSAVPLKDADLTVKKDKQIDLFSGICEGMCGV
jgi:ribosomal protein L44E